MMLRRHHLRWLAAVASSALFVYVVARVKPEVILDKVRLLGWGFAALILLSGIRSVLRAVAWSFCVQTDGRHPATIDLFVPRLVSEALNDALPLGPVLGETAKVVGISRFIPAQAGATSVVIEDLIYALAALTFMLGGVALALFSLTTSRAFQWTATSLLIGLLAAVLAAHWMARRQISVLGGTLDFLKRAGLRWAFLERHQSQLRAMERDIYDFFVAHKRLLSFVFAIEFATNFTGIAEAYLILQVTAAHASLHAAYLVETANRAVQLVFSFVPFQLGIQEGVAAATLETLGYAASEGVSLAIVRKIRTVFWTALGLLLAAKYAAPQSTTRESSAS
jgi:hypothetical protein